MGLYSELFYSKFTDELCSAEHFVRLMMDVELALVKAQEQQQIVPLGTAVRLKDYFGALSVDLEVLKSKIALSGNAAAPLVKQLVAGVKKKDEELAKYIHLGATSQDIVDTATILKSQAYLDWLDGKLAELEQILTTLTRQHRTTVMIGRTLMQQARPITFGLKTASWLRGIRSARRHLETIKPALRSIQLAGAVGSQNKYLTAAVRQSFAQLLQLQDAPGWHTQRVSTATLAGGLGVLVGSLGKIAEDIVLLSQTEVGEVKEPLVPGRGTSSTLPHKRNPILSTAILANAKRTPFLVATILATMPQAHERAAGSWHAEWETLDDIFGLTAGAVEKTIEVLEGLEVDQDRMKANLELTQGLIYAEGVSLALASKIGKEEAHEKVKSACQLAMKEGRHLSAIIEELNLDFSELDLEALFQAENAIGLSLEIIDEILAT